MEAAQARRRDIVTQAAHEQWVDGVTKQATERRDDHSHIPRDSLFNGLIAFLRQSVAVVISHPVRVSRTSKVR
ncbi:MAG: hypothetical protein U0Z70_15030 [Thermomicrobiales bacterium]